jgi:hypothetical protein
MDGPEENRSDVEIRQHARHEDDGALLVTNEIHCRFCVSTLLTPDVRTAIRWADLHELLLSHLLAKKEADVLNAAARED